MTATQARSATSDATQARGTRLRTDERERRAGRDPAEQRREAFRVLGPRELAERTRRRQVGRLAAVSAAVLAAALLSVAGAQALVAARQVRLDALQQELASAVTTNQSLQVSRATLESPSRIVSTAQRRLRMVSPGTVSYLAPVDPGPSVSAGAASIPIPPASTPFPHRASAGGGRAVRGAPNRRAPSGAARG
ncbi:MAG TPA: hypothetical protein VND23_00745 [Acidimicrobiales bacterium]|nr:hypothetical protein [Acidimicrobiales bacterium]